MIRRAVVFTERAVMRRGPMLFKQAILSTYASFQRLVACSHKRIEAYTKRQLHACTLE